MGCFIGPLQMPLVLRSALGCWHQYRASRKAHRPQKSFYCYLITFVYTKMADTIVSHFYSQKLFRSTEIPREPPYQI